MADYLQVVESIRSFLATSDRARSAELPQWANRYADLCHEVNDRLGRCADYLRRGHRGEALELAEFEPPLLDMVTALDFPEAADWDQICAAYNLTRPARPAMDAARDLNQAYGFEQPLAELTSRNRLLALARSPLPQRLSVLRELARRDVGNTVWLDDLVSLEQARLREIAAEALPAIRTHQTGTVDRLLTEINETPWTAPAPEDLKKALATASLAAHREGAVQRLWQLAPSVRAAADAGNYKRAVEVMKEWAGIVSRSGISVPAELRSIIQPLNALIDDEDERRERATKLDLICQRLMLEIRSGAEPSRLRELHLAAARLELPIPEDVEAAYCRRINEIEREQRTERRRSLWMTVGLVAAIVLALAALIVVILVTSNYS